MRITATSIINTALMLITAFQLSAQDGGGDKANIVVERDDPKQTLLLSGGAWIDYGFKPKCSRIGWTAKGAYLLGRFANVSGEVYMGIGKRDKALEESPSLNLKTHQTMEGRFSLHFSDQMGTKQEKIDVESSISGNTVTTKSFTANMTARQISALTFSVSMVRHPLQQGKDTIWNTYNANNQTPVYIPSFGTNIRMMMFSAGIQKIEITNYIARVKNVTSGKNYGRKKSRWRTELILEALYAPFVAYDKSMSVVDPLGNAMMIDIPHEPLMRKWGWCLRSEAMYNAGGSSGFKMEFGARPGVKYHTTKNKKMSNSYIILSYSFGISI
jgi:hypothetical protein